MKQGKLALAGGSIHYYEFGHGPHFLVALHGFAESGKAFQYLEAELAEYFTIYALDLPYHGFSDWQKETYQPDDLVSAIEMILVKTGQQRLSLMGYSLGGRIAIAILPKIIQRLDNLYLLAPDGLATQWMVFTEAMPRLLRRWFGKISKNPQWLFRLSALLLKIKVFDRFTDRYLNHHLSRPERHKRLINTWVSTSFFSGRIKMFKQILPRFPKLKVKLIIGKDDPLILTKKIKKLVGDIPEIELHLLEKDHQLIDKDLIPLLLN